MERTLWTLGVIAVIVLAGLLVLRGWRTRAASQAQLPALPAVPDGLDWGGATPLLTSPLTGVYVSTTRAGSWQDRIVAHGLGRRATASLLLHHAGVVIDRVGEDPIFLPTGDITAVSTAPGIAGKVMALPDGILLITWRLGDTLLDTGFRTDDPDAQREWIDAATARLVERPGADGAARDPARNEGQDAAPNVGQHAARDAAEHPTKHSDEGQP